MYTRTKFSGNECKKLFLHSKYIFKNEFLHIKKSKYNNLYFNPHFINYSNKKKTN